MSSSPPSPQDPHSNVALLDSSLRTTCTELFPHLGHTKIFGSCFFGILTTFLLRRPIVTSLHDHARKGATEFMFKTYTETNINICSPQTRRDWKRNASSSHASHHKERESQEILFKKCDITDPRIPLTLSDLK